ncbi:uncharacterized protein LOC128036185 [Gossypium raimondii]|uniref:uncharacterized protein LOC128036185 n=1 Tax=Gossypium raimondii TaxID=29730 RepID=UPI00227D1FBE|nr:uncharacterized protein LOC128036185 [Gossypium raimondii]
MTNLRAIFARLSLFDDNEILAELQDKPSLLDVVKSNQVLDESLISQVKTEHQLPPGLLQPVKITLWKWEQLTMDFVSGLPSTLTKKDSDCFMFLRLSNFMGFQYLSFQIGILVLLPVFSRSYMKLWIRGWILAWPFILKLMASPRDIQMVTYEAIYGKKCCTSLCSTELGERKVLGLELVAETEDKVRLIRDRLKAASDRKKSYADLKRREIEYEVGDHVFFKLELPLELYHIHDVFHMFMLRRYRSDPSHVVPVEEIELRPNFPYKEELIQILEHKVNVLKRKTILLVKVLWQNHGSKKATWEPKGLMLQQYPHLFEQEDNGEAPWRFTRFYGAYVESQRKESWNLLRRLKVDNQPPCSNGNAGKTE